MERSGEHGFVRTLIFTTGLFQRHCETGLARPGSRTLLTPGEAVLAGVSD